MATTTMYVEPPSITDSGGGSDYALVLDSFPDSAKIRKRWSVTTPANTSAISSITVWINRDAVGNLYLNFGTSYQVMTAGTAIQNDEASYTTYASAASDGTVAGLTVPTAAYNGITGLTANQKFDLYMERDASNASDTYNADLDVIRVDIAFTTTATTTAISTTVPFFVSDTDLKKYYPKLANFVWSTQSDYSTQIKEAHEIIKDDVRAMGQSYRTLLTHLDLMRAADSTADQDTTTSATLTSSTTYTHVNGIDGFVRFVLNVSSIGATSGYSFALQGSNEQDITDSTEPSNWTTVSTLTPTATGYTTDTFLDEYMYYRLVVTITAGTPAITFKAYLLETFLDRLIIHKTLQMICTDFSKEQNDVWDVRRAFHERAYQEALANHRYTVDDDEDNLIDEDTDTLAKANQTTFWR
jgi:hypothetical protein